MKYMPSQIKLERLSLESKAENLSPWNGTDIISGPICNNNNNNNNNNNSSEIDKSPAKVSRSYRQATNNLCKKLEAS